MSRRARFFIGLLILSPVLFLLWELWARETYMVVLRGLAAVLVGLADPKAFVVPVSVANGVPFLVLMLATPGMGPRRIVRGVSLGAAVLFPVHLLTVLFYTYWMTHPAPSPARMLAAFLVSAIQMALPIVLWVVLARGQIRALVFTSREGESGSA